jgi:hypothetical protein
MFFAALTSTSKMLPQLVQTKRDRPMRLAVSTAPQALQHCDVSAGWTTMIGGSVPRRLVLKHGPDHPRRHVEQRAVLVGSTLPDTGANTLSWAHPSESLERFLPCRRQRWGQHPHPEVKLDLLPDADIQDVENAP